jgi:tetraacyldisaccharide 4'-kinase
MNAQRLEAIWYGGERGPLWLRALEPVYRCLRFLSLVPWRSGWRKPTRLPVPVVIVGNLVAGGTGKTPLVIALVEALRTRGLHPGVVSRGYGGSAPTAMLLDARPDPAVVGDEPALIRLRTRAPVAVGRDRVSAARLLLDQQVDVVIADDGLQNPSLARDVEICVIDGVRRFGNQRLLPAGPLREPLTRLSSVDFRICNGGSTSSGEIPMRLEGTLAVPVSGERASRPLSSMAGEMVHALAAIGNPSRFFKALREWGLEVIEHPLPDHHALARSDIEFDDELPVLMTEKDAVKCMAFAGPRHWCVPVSGQVTDAFFDEVAARCRSWKMPSTA